MIKAAKIFFVLFFAVATAKSNVFAASNQEFKLPMSHLRVKADLSKFADHYDKFYYFATELTDKKIGFKILNYDYVDPMINKNLSLFSKGIFSGIRLLDSIKKYEENKRKIDEIEEFLNTNYKTQYLPPKIYNDNQHLAKPLYMGQIESKIFLAIFQGDLASVRALLDNYNLLNVTDHMGTGLLAYAIMQKQDEIAKLLIMRGADVNAQNHTGVTPLILAAQHDNLPIIKLLLESKACKIDHRDDNGKTALDYAILGHHEVIISYLKSMQQRKNAS